MQKNHFDSHINLSEQYLDNKLAHLIKIFPELNDFIIKQNNSNVNSTHPHQQMIIDKYVFYQTILEKIKKYFEVKESFIISESISIILKDINNKIHQTICKKSERNQIKNENILPLINRTKSRQMSKGRLNNETIEKNRTFRKYSTRSNGKEKINEPKHSNLNKIFNFEEVNRDKINYVYLNIPKNEKQKIRVVHFNDINGNIEFTQKKNLKKCLTKKSNLKKTNYKTKDLNRTINIINDNSINNQKSNKRVLFIKTKTEYPLMNKSNGMKLGESSSKWEKSEKSTTYNSTNYSLYEKNLNDEFNIDDKDFDIFEFDKRVGRENTLVLISKYIFNYFNFEEIINQSKFNNWCKKISEGYNRNNSYHTDLHAADITHTSYIFFKEGLINEIIKLDNSSICALFLSCICHDYKHPGLNNNYLIETNNEIAIRYNDYSVLENMHISETFKLIHSNKSYNIFEDLEKEKYKKIRKQMISCVLTTDMSNHKKSLDFMNKCLNENNQIQEDDKQNYMNLIVHSADISNPTKTFDIYYKWAELVVEEFYQQGDKEKELGLNCSCDRNKISLYKSQIGFIDYVEIPFYSLFVKVFPKLNFLYENLNNNRQRIKLLEEEKKE